MSVLTSVVLVLATSALGLGVGTVATRLMPSLPVLEERPLDHSAVVMADGGVMAAGPQGVRPDRDQAAMMPLDLEREPAWAALPRVSAAGPWTSPLYPQNGVTLWDRIRVSSQRDRRAFLLGTAIHTHARATAATPGPRFAPPPPHGSD